MASALALLCAADSLAVLIEATSYPWTFVRPSERPALFAHGAAKSQSTTAAVKSFAAFSMFKSPTVNPNPKSARFRHKTNSRIPANLLQGRHGRNQNIVDCNSHPIQIAGAKNSPNGSRLVERAARPLDNSLVA
jgi:hypothetical protein